MSRIPNFANVPFADPPLPNAGDAESWLTPEGIDIHSVYGERDLAEIDFLNTWPGRPPYLRGPYPAMYAAQPWTIRQYAGFSTAEDSNTINRRNLAAGQIGRAGAAGGPRAAAAGPAARAGPGAAAGPAARGGPAAT